MKGKSKFLNRLFVSILTFAISASALFAGVMLNKTRYADAVFVKGEVYSQKDEGDIVLSVEKVGIASTGDDYLDSTDYDEMQNFYSNNYVFQNPLYKLAATESGGTEYKQTNNMFVNNRSGEEKLRYYYTDIKNTATGDEKTVYHSGDYIMLENSLKTQTNASGQTYTYYYTPNITAYNSSTGEQEVSVAEGVLFSFGSYIYNTTETVSGSIVDLKRNTDVASVNGENVNYYQSNVQQINVSASRNGKQIILPTVRQYGVNNYQDFTYIIPQRAGFDGHYEFVVEYRHNEEFKRQTFTFELVFKSTYTEPETFTNGSGQAYATLPTLNMQNATDRKFELGSGSQYPTLTYDFSKYTLDYTHTSNNVTTKYSYRRVRQENVSEKYSLVYTATNSDGTITRKIDLNDGQTKAVIVFTEVGSYNFSYDYIYNGEQNSMGFELQGDNLTIVGYELKYSKVGYTEAQMRYVEINKHINDKVALIVPNGYERNNQPNDQQKLGIVYTINETTLTGPNNRTGYINKREDALLNKADFAYLNDMFNAFAGKGADAETKLNEIKLDKSIYQTTNQGGIWLASNLTYMPNKGSDGSPEWNSFYYYSNKPMLEAADLPDRQAITNTTTFNKVGYYLVFVTVDDGLSGFKQMFAFSYTNQTSIVNVGAYNETTKEYDVAIGSGKYTNQNVKIWWEEPKVFERAVDVKYYSILNTYLTRDESKSNHSNILTANELRAQVAPQSVRNGLTILGTDIPKGEGASFLIEATNEGQAKAYRSFTIDRTYIKGVGVYAVSRAQDSNGKDIYRIQVDETGVYKKIDCIADIFATIYWNDKASGANITASYYYTPILKDSAADVTALNDTSTQVWFTNKYKLGTQTGPFKIEKTERLNYAIGAANVLKNDGVYLFELVDDAGNKTNYLLVIDSSEQYFKIKTQDGYYKQGNNEYFTQTSMVFASKVDVEYATHKAIKMFNTSKAAEDKSITEKMIENLVNGETPQDYYIWSGSNLGVLAPMFKSFNGTNYLVVENTEIAFYNQQNSRKDMGKTIAKPSSTQNPYYTVDPATKTNEERDFNAFVRKIFIAGRNQVSTSSITNSNSYIRIEINDDHSLGKVYFTFDTTKLADESYLIDNNYELSTGKTINGAQATSDNLVAFYWTQGTGNYNIQKISYKYYALAQNYKDASYAFYGDVTNEGVLFGENVNGLKVNGETDRFYNTLYVQDGKTQEGLYIITRTYVDGNTQEYWFIVDRQGIISDVAGQEIGKYIHLWLREETEFNNFSTSLEDKTLTYIDNGGIVQERISYSLNITTNKVPLQVKVPVGKYFDGVNASSYYAGRLNFTLYFLNEANQLGEEYNTVDENGARIITPIKIFSTKEYAGGLTLNEQQTYYTNGGYLMVDLSGYLKGSLLARFVQTGSDGSYLWLPGNYVVVIEDNVASSRLASNGRDLATTKTAFGFTISNAKPTAEVSSTLVQENDAQTIETANPQNQTLLTNAEFVRVVLPAYQTEGSKAYQAQVDPDYLIVERSTDNGNSYTTYINYQHGLIGGTAPELLADGGRIAWLDTGLKRKADNSIDYQNSEKSVKYRITVRFSVSEPSVNNEKYKNFYAYYSVDSGTLVYYYETTYFVTIDRIPPTTNTENLESSDSLVAYYNQQNGTDKMMGLAVHDTSAGLYFVNQYTKYYQTKSASDLYAFVVNGSTQFDTTDVEAIYYRAITNNDLRLAELNMPITIFATYSSVSSVNSIQNYGNIPDLKNGYYYEIVEVDAAGNMNQYLILFTTNQDRLTFTFNADYIGEAGQIEQGNVTLGRVDENGNPLISNITLFEINALTTDQTSNNITDVFFRIELTNSITSYTYSINTNATTNFTDTGLTAEICTALTNAGHGNYTLKVVSRLGEQVFTINYYDKGNRVEINPENLVKIDNSGVYRIELAGANILENNILYYAREIEISCSLNGVTSNQIYVCQISADGVKYYLQKEDGTLETSETTVVPNLNGTYKITLTDAFGDPKPYRFDTRGEKFYNIAFEGTTDAGDYYYEHANIYYGFRTATITYNTDLYKKILFKYSVGDEDKSYIAVFNELEQRWVVSLDNREITDFNGSITYKYSANITDVVEIIRLNFEANGVGTIKFMPLTVTNAGATIKYTAELWDADTVDRTYNVVIDTFTKPVMLKNTDNVEHQINFEYCQNFEDVAFNSTTSGVMNLMWTPIENSYFKYSYTLHEKLQDDSIADYDLNGLSNWVINTVSTSKGVYWFEIRISTADGKYLGNKVYAFSVVAVLTDLYYVQTEDMVALKANSSFKFSELTLDSSILNKLKKQTSEELSLPITNIPLYISNKKLMVIVATDQGATGVHTDALRQDDTNGNKIGEFTIYRVYTKTYSRYFALLEMVEPSDGIIATNFEYSYLVKDKDTSNTTTKIETVKNFEQSVYLDKKLGSTLTFIFDQKNAVAGRITAKNSVVLNVYHNNELLEKVTVNNLGQPVKYTIKGSGKYSFEICDLAGNIQKFVFNDDEGTRVTFSVMKDIFFTMNGLAPIENAVFNDAVELAVFEPSAYDSINTKPIDIKQATRNGEAYKPTQKGYAYTFADYGNYKVTFKAAYEGEAIETTINFTVLNKNEARATYDLTSIARYTITKVVNQEGTDITEKFLQLINPQSENGRLLSYQTLLENADQLGITAGKQSFEITYQVEDDIYPTRSTSFVLTMNDEQPTIECSVELGKETTKGFDITFNPGIIYEQVGDSFLYINDDLIYTVNENSELGQVQHSISEKTDGAGDYYVKLVGSSGNVIASFKVVVKEPLNIWAIIIIVVVSAIVLGVTITIIVLRNKMRIR